MFFYLPAPKTVIPARLTSLHPWAGHIRLAVLDSATRRIKRLVNFDNLITDVGKDFFSSQLGAASQAGIGYVALGNVATTPASGDTVLGGEIFRKQITRQTQTAGSKNLLSTVFISSFECNQQIQEIGWFAGNAASATANTGVMIAHVLYARLKTNTESLQIDRTDQF